MADKVPDGGTRISVDHPPCALHFMPARDSILVGMEQTQR